MKYKVWHVGREKFIQDDTNVYLTPEGEVVEIDEGTYGHMYKNIITDSVKIVRYTGLKDKNGVEICESDIIQYDMERYEVYWSEDWAMFTVKGCQVQALMRYASYGEVVGNIYEGEQA